METITGHIRGVKQGFILEQGDQIPMTLLVFEEDGPDGWNKRPPCNLCGIIMSENYYIDKVTGIVYHTWWCMSEKCRKLHNEGFSRKHRNERILTLEENPGKILPAYGIPQKYFHTSFDSFEGNYAMVNKARVYAENPCGNLFFTGGPGTGKTHMAIAILREIIRSGEINSFIREAPELLLETRRGFDTREDKHVTETETIDRYSAYEFLVLDDLGAEKVSEYSASIINILISRRINYLKPTVVTSNLSIAEIREKIDARLASRLSEGQVWVFDGPDRRKKRV